MRWLGVTRQARCVITGSFGCLLWPVTGAVLVETDAVVRLEAALAQALEANDRLVELVERQRGEIAARDVELGRVNAELAMFRFGPLAVVRPGSGGRALGQAGGITRTFRGRRWCGTSPMAATAARSAARRFTGWGTRSPRCWTGW